MMGRAWSEIVGKRREAALKTSSHEVDLGVACERSEVRREGLGSELGEHGRHECPCSGPTQHRRPRPHRCRWHTNVAPPPKCSGLLSAHFWASGGAGRALDCKPHRRTGVGACRRGRGPGDGVRGGEVDQDGVAVHARDGRGVLRLGRRLGGVPKCPTLVNVTLGPTLRSALVAECGTQDVPDRLRGGLHARQSRKQTARGSFALGARAHTSCRPRRRPRARHAGPPQGRWYHEAIGS